MKADIVYVAVAATVICSIILASLWGWASLVGPAWEFEKYRWVDNISFSDMGAPGWKEKTIGNVFFSTRIIATDNSTKSGSSPYKFIISADLLTENPASVKILEFGLYSDNGILVEDLLKYIKTELDLVPDSAIGNDGSWGEVVVRTNYCFTPAKFVDGEVYELRIVAMVESDGKISQGKAIQMYTALKKIRWFDLLPSM